MVSHVKQATDALYVAMENGDVPTIVSSFQKLRDAQTVSTAPLYSMRSPLPQQLVTDYRFSERKLSLLGSKVGNKQRGEQVEALIKACTTNTKTQV